MRIRVFVILAAVVAAVSFSQGQQRPPATAGASTTRPNVVLIMSDDLGYADLSSYGATDIQTPTIDKIGEDGIRLTDFYANGVLCSPSRAGLITGRYQQRYAIENALGGEGTAVGLTVTGRSLPQLLENNNYATGLVGKWHLGGKPEFYPRAHGFEYFWGFIGSHDDYYHHNRGPMAPDLWENETKIQEEGYLTDLITDKSISFIERSVAAHQAFFVDVAYNAPHWPYQPPGKPTPGPGTGAQQRPGDANTTTRADYGAMVESVNQGVAKILSTLQRLGQTNNTIVIFTNDNGGEWISSNHPLFNRKWTVWEGGIRVPALVKWPGHIPPGRVSDQVGITMDLSASILAATGSTVPPETKLEGINLFPILEGGSPEVERTLYWRTNVGNRTMRAVRSGDWKLVVDSNHEFLFNLRRDISERDDLTNRRQDLVAKLRPMLTKWETEVDADAAATFPEFVATVTSAPGYIGRGRGQQAGAAGGGQPAATPAPGQGRAGRSAGANGPGRGAPAAPKPED